MPVFLTARVDENAKKNCGTQYSILAPFDARLIGRSHRPGFDGRTPTATPAPPTKHTTNASTGIDGEVSASAGDLS